MRKRTIRRQLAAIGKASFRPTPEQQQLVRILSYNETPLERIAQLLKLSVLELQMLFADELQLSKDQFLAVAAQTVVECATQRGDLGVALRASELMLKARLAVWREPKQTEAAVRKRISAMSLEEVEAELAALDERRRAAASTAEPEAAPPDGAQKLH